jgi:hypothetical protein
VPLERARRPVGSLGRARALAERKTARGLISSLESASAPLSLSLALARLRTLSCRSLTSLSTSASASARTTTERCCLGTCCFERESAEEKRRRGGGSATKHPTKNLALSPLGSRRLLAPRSLLLTWRMRRAGRDTTARTGAAERAAARAVERAASCMLAKGRGRREGSTERESVCWFLREEADARLCDT